MKIINMSIRLNKALRELNIGLQTAVEFLEKRSELGEVKPEPSFKLNDEQYQALMREFQQDKEVRTQAEKLQLKKPKEKKRAQGPKDHRADKLLSTASQQQYKPLGKIDLDSINKPAAARKASVPDAERVILEDYKERSEHNTIVDLIRNDLNRVAERVDVKRFRYIDRLRVSRGEILQVSSEVTGRLTGDYYSRLGEIVFGMLPAGSISGAPKPSTLRIITQAERERRGFYTGVFGYFDGKKLDSAVMIRYIEVRDGRYYFRSGGGITINSDCRAEYEEVLAKVYLPFGNERSK